MSLQSPRRSLVISFCIVCLIQAAPVGVIHAQQDRLDSLSTIVHSSKLLAKQDLLQLAEKIHKLRSKNPERVRSLIDELLPHARKRHEVKTEARIHCLIASLYEKKKDYRTAIQHNSQSLNLYKTAGDTRGEALALKLIGFDHFMLKEYEQAIVYYRLSRTLAEQHGYLWDTGSALFGIADAYRDMDSTGTALDYYKQSLFYFEKVEPSRQMLTVLGKMTTILCEQNSFEEAREYAESQLPLYHLTGDTASLAFAYGRLGWIYDRLSKTDLAIMYYKKQLDRENLYGGGCHKCTLTNLGLIYLRQKKYDSAMIYHQELLRIAIADGDSAVMAEQRHHIGIVIDAVGRHGEALSYFREAYRIWEMRRDSAYMTSALTSMGEIYRHLGKSDSALHCYSRARDLAERRQDTFWMMNVYKGLSQQYIATQMYDSALVLLNRVLSLHGEHLGDRRNIGPDVTISDCLALIGDIYRRTKRYSDAVAYLRRAEEISLKTPKQKGLQFVYLKLSKLYEEFDNAPEALRTYRKSVALRDSTRDEAMIDQVNKLSAKYESYKKDQQIVVLEKTRQLQALELDKRQKEITIRTLQAERNFQRAELLSNRNELQLLTIRQKSMSLDLERAVNRQKLSSMQRVRDNQVAVARKATMLRNFLVIALFLVLAITILLVIRIRAKRLAAILRAKAAEHQAEAASYRAQVAEYEARVSETERLRLQAESERQQRMAQQEFSRNLLNSQEQERRRIAGELHDELGQDLLVIRNAVLTAIKEGHGDGYLQTAAQTASVMLDNVRRLTRDLRPFQLDRYGLASALAAMVDRINNSVPINFIVGLDPVDGVFTKEQEIHLYRIVQEGLNNIVKHSEASEARVSLLHRDKSVELRIEDNGKGMLLSVRKEDLGFGLQNIRQRAELLGGTLAFSSAPAVGTSIHIVVPIPLIVDGVDIMIEDGLHA